MKTLSLSLPLSLSTVAAAGCASPSGATTPAAPSSEPSPAPVATTFELVLTPDARWEHLNPARGDKAPQAATLWGDRNGTEATGYLLKPSDGFRSPPHVHNVSYRGLVIRGRIHNDDPAAEEHWMTAGSYWTQPKGDVHITAAQGTDTLAYIEIDEGPYLVLPVEQAFASEEKPTWLDAAEVAWTSPSGGSASPESVQVCVVWGDARGEGPSGTLVKLPGGFEGELRSDGSTLRVVTIAGGATHRGSPEGGETALEPGSYFGSQEPSVHHLSCETGPDCVLYARADARLEVTPAPR